MVQGCVAGIFTPESSIGFHWGRPSAHKVLTVLTKHRLVPPLAWPGQLSAPPPAPLQRLLAGLKTSLSVSFHSILPGG